MTASPAVRPGLDTDRAEDLAVRLRALADPTRLRLLALIAAADDSEACVCELTDPVGLSQPTVSHHLKLLVDAGYLVRIQRGRWAFYRLVEDAVETVGARLSGLTRTDSRPGCRSRARNC